jgi:hypothetical protein
VGEADAVAPLGAHPAVGQAVRLGVDPGRLAVWATAPAPHAPGAARDVQGGVSGS